MQAGFAQRFGLHSGRYAPCVQPETPAGPQRENINAASDISPKSVQFSIAIDSPGNPVHLPYAQNRMVLGGYRDRTPGVTVPMQRARVIFHDKCCELDGPLVHWPIRASPRL